MRVYTQHTHLKEVDRLVHPSPDHRRRAGQEAQGRQKGRKSPTETSKKQNGKNGEAKKEKIQGSLNSQLSPGCQTISGIIRRFWYNKYFLIL